MDRAINQKALLKPHRAIPMAAAGVLFVVGSFGALNEAWGYGLLLVATVALLLGIGTFAIFLLSRQFDSASLSSTRGSWCSVDGFISWGYQHSRVISSSRPCMDEWN